MTAIADANRVKPEAATRTGSTAAVEAPPTTQQGAATATSQPSATQPYQARTVERSGATRYSNIGLPGTQGPAATQKPEAPAAAETPVGAYGDSFGHQSYVKNGSDANLMGLMSKAIAKAPELANGPLGEAVKSGSVGPEQMKTLQSFLESKGYPVGKTGVDGKYGPKTHAAMASFLNGEAPKPASTTQGPRPASVDSPDTTQKPDPTQAATPGGAQVPNDPNAYFISQYKSDSNPNAKAHNGNCGPTSMLMAAKAFGAVNPSPSQVAAATTDLRHRGGATSHEIVGTNSGTSIDQLAKAGQSYGLNATPKNGATMNDVQNALNQGKLVVALVKPSGYSNSRSQGHYVLVTKVENGKVYLNDPAQRTGPRVVPLQGFTNALRMKGGEIVTVGR